MFTRSLLGRLLVVSTLSLAALAGGCASGGGDDSESGAGAATSGPQAGATVSRSYQGAIKDLKIMVRLSVSGANVTGSYFYVDKVTQGEVIALKGTLNGSKLSLDESVGGNKTGSLAGTISGTKITGTWKKPDGTGQLPLTLDSIASGTLVTVKRTIKQSQASKQPGFDGPGKCELSADYLEVFGLADAAAENKINTALAVKPFATSDCDFPFSSTITQAVKLDDSGLLVVAINEEDDGGAHPSESVSAKNFSTATGAELQGHDIFKPEALAKINDIVKASVTNDGSLSAEDKQMTLDELANQTQNIDAYNMEVSKDGVNVDLFDEFPHAIQGLAPSVLLKWDQIRDVLAPNTEVAKIAH